MRILALHDQYSSGHDLSQSLHKLEQQLRDRHKIELVFVDSPIIADQIDDKNGTLPKRGEKPFNARAARADKRIWFDPNKVGLDASILHLRQIWSHSLHSKPFCGILGVGQGAAISAIIPHLIFQSGNEEEDTAMFEGLRFCTFIHGWDILASNDSVNECYDDVQNIPTLHISRKSDTRSRILFHRYGGKENGSCALNYLIEDEPSRYNANTVDVRILNKIGKFFVAQKKAWKADKDMSRSAMVNDDTWVNGQRLVLDYETTRMKICQLESKAMSLLHSSIAANPPKALMAVIAPNGDEGNKFVGGWEGPKDAFRSSGFKESGGAPCPETFTLRRNEREKIDSRGVQVEQN